MTKSLGHSSIDVTADTYGHLVPGGNRQAVDRLDDPDLNSDPNSENRMETFGGKPSVEENAMLQVI